MHRVPSPRKFAVVRPRAWVRLAILAPLLIACEPATSNLLPRATPEEVGVSSERLERLDTAMQRYIDDNLLAGTVTLVSR